MALKKANGKAPRRSTTITSPCGVMGVVQMNRFYAISIAVCLALLALVLSPVRFSVGPFGVSDPPVEAYHVRVCETSRTVGLDDNKEYILDWVPQFQMYDCVGSEKLIGKCHIPEGTYDYFIMTNRMRAGLGRLVFANIKCDGHVGKGLNFFE